MILIRCVICNHETEMGQEGWSGCPNCGTAMHPVMVQDDVEIKINWVVLGALVMWAERWAHQSKGDTRDDMLRFVYNAAVRLQKQHPKRPILTLAGQIEELRREYGPVETNLPSSEPEPRLTVEEAMEEVRQRLRDEGKEAEG